MKFHVTFDAEDLLALVYTGNTSRAIGHQLCPDPFGTAPSLYAFPGQLRAIADHFAVLAEQVGE